MNCPKCQTPTLIQQNYEGCNITKCSSCYGVWLSPDDLLDIISIRDEKFTLTEIKETLAKSFSGVPENERAKTLNCPTCKTKLNANNYAMSSGIIIDRCPNDHGIWLDQDELEHIQQFRESSQDRIDAQRSQLDQKISSVSEAEEKSLVGIFGSILSSFKN